MQSHIYADSMFLAVISHTYPQVFNCLYTLCHQQRSLHLLFLPPTVPLAPVRPLPASRLAETKHYYMASCAQHKGPDALAFAYPPTARRRLYLTHLPSTALTPAQRRRGLDERLRQVTRLQRS